MTTSERNRALTTGDSLLAPETTVKTAAKTTSESDFRAEARAGSRDKAGRDFAGRDYVSRDAAHSWLDHESREAFDPRASEFTTSWASGAKLVCCINAYPNGITLSYHTQNVAGERLTNCESSRGDTVRADGAQGGVNVSARQKPLGTQAGDDRSALGGRGTPDSGPDSHSIPFEFDAVDDEEQGTSAADLRLDAQKFHLRFRETRDYQLPVGKYFLHRENFAAALEKHLAQLNRSGDLSNAVFYFGTVTDAFHSLHKKFDVTMKCIGILERFAPGLTVFQTRSPMIISILPALKQLGEKAVVVMPVETISERAAARYIPGKPKIGERLIAAEGLRRQGIRVNLQASPMLPYGDPKRDAWDFAEVLSRYGDYVTFGSLATGHVGEEKFLKNLPIAQKLNSDEQYFWLRPHCYQYVAQALMAIAPEKLRLPLRTPVQQPSQLGLFAA